MRLTRREFRRPSLIARCRSKRRTSGCGRWRRANYKLLYIAPERLESEYFRELVRELEIPLIAVDEAHCVSQWGHDFRPSYMTIIRLLRDIEPRPVMAAFTATATDVVKDDIVERLKLSEPVRVTTGYARDNLALSVVRNADKRDYVARFFEEHPGQAGIIYASTRREVESVPCLR